MYKKFNKFSIKWKILIIFTIISLLMVSVISLVSAYLNRKNSNEMAKSMMVYTANEIRSNIDLFFNEKILQIQSTAKNEYVIDFLTTGNNKDYVEKYLESQFDKFNQFENYFIADKNGFVTASAINKEKAEGLDIKIYPFWELSENNADYHIDDLIYRSPLTDKLVTVVATRITDKNNNFLGLVCMPVFWDDFIKKNILKNKIGETGYVIIIDKNKRVIAHENTELLLNDFSKYDFINKAVAEKNGFRRYYFDLQRKWKYMGYSTMEYTNWLIAPVIDDKELTGGIRRTQITVIAISFLIFLIGAIIIFVFINGISNVIKIITDGANRFAVGDIVLEGMDWNNIAKINSRNDELGSIGRAFKKLIGYLKNKIGIAEDIAKGNFNIDVDISSNEDQLGIAMSKTVSSLNSLLSQVNSSVDQVNSGAVQVSSASQIVSQGATEQASSLEEISSSITEISSQSKQNASHAENVNQIAKKSKDQAQQGNYIMTQLVEAMGKINTSSDEIKKIVKVIDDIAFQTNLLALNANVEAARAGKYGKGFAVVAEEVRNLATRSAESVKETTLMVEESIKNIETSNQFVEKTARQLEEIVKGAEDVVNLVEEISFASKEQAQGLDQINIGLSQIDQVTQSNTASAEESASASEELASQAEILKSLVSEFKLKKLEYNSANNNITEDNLDQNEDHKDLLYNTDKYITDENNNSYRMDDRDFGKF